MYPQTDCSQNTPNPHGKGKWFMSSEDAGQVLLRHQYYVSQQSSSNLETAMALLFSQSGKAPHLAGLHRNMKLPMPRQVQSQASTT